LACSGGVEQSADTLRGSPILANHFSHVVFGDTELYQNPTIVFDLSDLNSVWIIDEGLG